MIQIESSKQPLGTFHLLGFSCQILMQIVNCTLNDIDLMGNKVGCVIRVSFGM